MTESRRTLSLLTCLFTVALGSGVGWRLAAPAPQAAPPQETLNALSSSFAVVAQKARTSVVNISTVDAPTAQGTGGATGSGFIIDREGHVVTNLHVVQSANRITVRLADSTQYAGKFLAGDAETDLAIVKIQPRGGLQPLAFGDSDILRVGDWVIAIGSPFGLEQTVTTGIISAKERVTDRRNTLQQFLQTDAAINPGNSGGPLLNLNGEVVGVNTLIASRDGGYSGIGFALPAQTVRDVTRQLIERGSVSRSLLGIYVDRVTPQFARIYNLPGPEGALVQFLDEGGPAETAGLRSGDVIVEFNDRKVLNDRDLIRDLASTPGDTTVRIGYIRDGKLRSTELRTEERYSPPARTGPPRIERKGGNANSPTTDDERPVQRRLGIQVATATPIKLKLLGLENLYADPDGVLVTGVSPFGVAAEVGLTEGSLIVSINRKPVRTQADFEEVTSLLRPGDDVVLMVKRPAGGRTAAGDRRLAINYLSLTMP
jgi:serine protease Do